MMDRILHIMKMYGLEYFKLYYSEYPAFVEDVNDPEERCRIKVKVPVLQVAANQALANWAEPVGSILSGGDDKGSFFVPDVGDMVWVSFRHGSLSSPLWRAASVRANGKPAEFSSNTIRGIKTSSGHLIIFNDTSGEESIKISNSVQGSTLLLGKDGEAELSVKDGSKILVQPDGTITASTSGGSIVKLSGGGVEVETSGGTRISATQSSVAIAANVSVNVNAPSVSLDAQSIALGGSSAISPLLKGDAFLTWLATFVAWAFTHTHPAPNAPAVPPPPPPNAASFISTTSRTK
jgi:phage baseplate assembly protein gpV